MTETKRISKLDLTDEVDRTGLSRRLKMQNKFEKEKEEGMANYHLPLVIGKLVKFYNLSFIRFHRRPIQIVISCRPFVVLAIFSTGLFGCRSFFCLLT